MSTGKNIKKVRKWRGITQEELGKALGIGEGSAGTRIAQYETGKRTPKGEILGKISRVLFVNLLNEADWVGIGSRKHGEKDVVELEFWFELAEKLKK